MPEPISKKTSTRIYRNGQSVFNLDLEVTLKTDCAGEKHLVCERRKGLFDEKVIFVGTEEQARKFYDAIPAVENVAGGNNIFASK